MKRINLNAITLKRNADKNVPFVSLKENYIYFESDNRNKLLPYNANVYRVSPNLTNKCFIL